MISPSDYLDLEDLTPGNILLLQQAYARLRDAGWIAHHSGEYVEFLDVVTARHEYSDTSTDYIYIDDEIREKQPLMEKELGDEY